VATKRDLDQMELLQRADLDRTRTELRSEIHQAFGTLRSEMHQELGEVHQELGRVHERIADLTGTLVLTMMTMQLATIGATAAIVARFG
jgi:hypothetical protein